MKTIKIQRKEVRRHGVHISLTQERSATIGSYLLKSGAVGTGITFEQSKRWMPGILGMESTDPKFRSEVNKYFNNIMIPVPFEGKELNITLDESGEPENLEDYLKYLFVKGHPKTAESKAVADTDQYKEYYIEDQALELTKKTKKLRSKTDATIKFAELISDEVKLDWVARELTTKYPKELGSITMLTSLPKEEKELKVSEVFEKDPQYFMDVVSDPDLLFKAQIASMVESQVVQKVGNEYVYGSEPLGDLNAAIAYMKNPNNSEAYTIMLAKLNSMGVGFKHKEKVVKEKSK
jgi:hypothetical protein